MVQGKLSLDATLVNDNSLNSKYLNLITGPRGSKIGHIETRSEGRKLE